MLCYAQCGDAAGVFMFVNLVLCCLPQSNPIGSGCDTLNKCHGNGVCNYCSSKCDCFDGYGSVYDLQFAVVQDFNPDCSSKAWYVESTETYIHSS